VGVLPVMLRVFGNLVTEVVRVLARIRTTSWTALIRYFRYSRTRTWTRIRSRAWTWINGCAGIVGRRRDDWSFGIGR
jgi:hypothetical protein